MICTEEEAAGLSELVFVNVYRAQESIPPAYVAWRDPARQKGFSYRPARLGNDSWSP
jgi:hypothetical protein